ncbi:hypothetical protein F8O06_02845 [Pseudoclavibacter sp. CFCC 14310]|uniref:hypothetical protein n=1 Tax=Pseudoclavibacter sp. CFCC 14310 TaxID=2615180 RepID=UPI00130196CE|nr:hypothetical protein [Pseudoclavibacter sp. CFCC 14310]KAB1647495.1 hypothetical protein F8O06_02845 [Pseudoclavibacter sp. CFCC 14310]
MPAQHIRFQSPAVLADIDVPGVATALRVRIPVVEGGSIRDRTLLIPVTEAAQLAEVLTEATQGIHQRPAQVFRLAHTGERRPA